MPRKNGTAQTALAESLLSEMVGVLVMSRCVSGDEEAERLFSLARTSVQARASGEHAAGPSAERP